MFLSSFDTPSYKEQSSQHPFALKALQVLAGSKPHSFLRRSFLRNAPLKIPLHSRYLPRPRPASPQFRLATTNMALCNRK